MSEKHTPFDVFRHGHHIDRVYFISSMTVDEVRRVLIEHDGYPADIEVKPQGGAMNPVPRKIEVLLERYWINQPSKLQPYHNWHGARVLAHIAPGDRYTRAYFTSGNTISAIIAVEALSKGWPNSEQRSTGRLARKYAEYGHHVCACCGSPCTGRYTTEDGTVLCCECAA